MELPFDSDNPVLLTAGATVVGYGVILFAMFVVVFGLPFLLFRLLG